MSAPAKGRVLNPQTKSSARHPYIQISNRPGSAFNRLMADPEYRAILFRDNVKALAAAGYTPEGQSERDYEQKHGNGFLREKPTGETKVNYRSATSSKGWHAEVLKLQRGKLPARCLLDAAHNKYPVCGQDGVLDCRGVRAAKQRAHINTVRGVPGARSVEIAAEKLLEGYCQAAPPEPSTRKRRSSYGRS